MKKWFIQLYARFISDLAKQIVVETYRSLLPINKESAGSNAEHIRARAIETNN